MKEFGGYFEYEKYHGKEYHQTLTFDSARSSFAYVIDKRNYKHIYIPYYLCGCVKELLEAKGIVISYYHIDEMFRPMLRNVTTTQEECVLLVNYFGQLEDHQIRDIIEKYNIFLDNTQSFFHKPYYSIDAANSCRKFFGVSGGSYLYTNLSSCNLEKYEYDSSLEKMVYLIGRFETTASKYYDSYLKSEDIRRGMPIKRMSKFDKNILRSLDYEYILEKRKHNYKYLSGIFAKNNKLCLKNYAGLFMYPLLVDDGDYLKKKLVERKIYVPTLWPGVDSLDNLNEFESNLVKNLVLLPIDQRYDIDDMKYIVNVVKSYFANV